MKPAVETVRTIDIRGAGGWSASWVSWSPNGRMLAVGAADVLAIRFIDVASGQTVRELPTREGVLYAEWSHDGRFLAAMVPGRVIVLNWPNGDMVARLAQQGTVLTWHPDHAWLTISARRGVEIFEVETRRFVQPPFEKASVVDAVWLADGILVSGISHDFWMNRDSLVSGQVYSEINVAAAKGLSFALGGRNVRVVTEDSASLELEHRGTPITSLSFSHDAHLLAVRSADGETAIWEVRNRKLLHSYRNDSPSNTFRSIAFSPVDNLLATPVAFGSQLAILRVNPDAEGTTKSTFYTTAKIALVGDSGVGKTGLGWRLAHGEFKEHASTHGEQFWVVDNISTVRDDGAQCEAVLFDLAGQPDYRLIHTLFLDDVDVALVVFDPTNGQDPLKGAQFWLQALGQRARTILVPARSDRGTGILTAEELQQFAQQEGITGGVVVTSARNGEGIEELLECIRAEVDWNGRPATVTTETFKAIKDHVLTLKEADATKGLLVTPQQLRDAVSEAAQTDFALQDVTAAARHLANHGYVRELRGSHGDAWILLAPQLLHNLAASIVLEARRNPKGLGALDERRLLAGDYHFPELEGLTEREREILLDAATALFMEHNVSFRQALGNDVFLVFPSLINQKRPLLDKQPTVDGNAYTVTGAVESVYPALVVLLGYTNTFTRTNQWRNNARYEVGGHICGFRLIDEREGAIDLVLYFGEAAPPSARQLFQGLFETFLATRPVTVESFPPVACPSCDDEQPRGKVMKRTREGKRDLFCTNCGTRVAIGGPAATAHSAAVERNRRVATSRTQFETVLTALKGHLRDIGAGTPTCFLCYAHGTEDADRWVENLAADLKTSGISVLLDRWHSRPGDSIARFAERMERADFIAVIGTEELRAKYDGADHFVARELELAARRLGKRAVIPLLRSGDPAAAFPPLMNDAAQLDFREDDRYFARLFDLLVRLYDIAPDEKAVRDLRDALHFRPA